MLPTLNGYSGRKEQNEQLVDELKYLLKTFFHTMEKINNLRVLRKKQAIAQYNMKHRKFEKLEKTKTFVNISHRHRLSEVFDLCIFSAFFKFFGE